MASISEPFLLHSYAVPSAAGPSSCRGLPHVQANARWGDAAEVTVTVQGDGIHTIDRSSLHAVSSYTLGPSTFFQSAAVSRVGKGGKRATYVSIATASDIKDNGKTAWVWPEGSEDTASRKSIELSYPAQDFLFPTSLPDQVVIVSPDGSLTLAASNLDPIQDLSPPFTITGRAKNFIFPKQLQTVGTTPGSTHQAVLLSFFGNEEGKFGVRVVRVSEKKLTEVGWVQLDDIKVNDVFSVSCEAGGNASVLVSSGQCFSFQISATSSVSYSSSSAPINTSVSKSSLEAPQASLLSLMSTHMLLATASPSSRQIQLDLWDTRYPVQLASYSMALPANLPEKFALYLSHATSGQALITLTCPLGAKKGDSKTRSSIFIVPYFVPHTSSLINALGRLQVSEPQASQGDSALSDAERGLVRKVGEALGSGASDEAQKTFMDWVNLQPQATSNGVHAGVEQEDKSDEEGANGVNGVLNEDSDEATLTNSREVNGASRPKPNGAAFKKKALLHLPTALVEQLLDTLLVPPQPSTDAHSFILRFLMRKGLVSYSMVKGEQKLLDVLLERGDWPGVVSALQGVVDIPESAVVRVLLVGLKDTGAAPPLPLPNVVAAVLAAPVTRPALRLALKEQLKDIADVCRVLEVLQGWLVQSGLRGFELDAQGAGVVEVDFRPKPRIDAILSFAETLIDTYFISLLQHPPARPILRELSSLLAPQLTLATHLERLRGPLEVFAKRKRLQKQSGRTKAAVSRFEEGRRRKRAQEEVELQVGLYQVEEFFF